MNILWLTSWYPNRISPFDGDFIQRHAHAVASRIPLTVIYVAQYGELIPVSNDEIVITNNGNLGRDRGPLLTAAGWEGTTGRCN